MDGISDRWVENDPAETLSRQQKYVIEYYSASPVLFADLKTMISGARKLVDDKSKAGEAKDAVYKIEARIITAQKSQVAVKRYKSGIFWYDVLWLMIALAIGWFALCGPYWPCRSCDNSTQATDAIFQKSEEGTAHAKEQDAVKNPMEINRTLNVLNWLTLGFAAGILGGVVISVYGLVDHGIKGDFSDDYLIWYWLKPFKGALSGAVATLPFMAGLVVFQIQTSVQVQTAIAYISIVAFLVGFNERYFLQLLNTVGKMIFKPSETNGGSNTTASPG